MLEPKEGMEVLYNSEWEKKKAIINTNSFPWVNVKFGPTSKTMRKDQHHTILDSGYGKIVSNIQYDKQKNAGKTISTLIGAGTVEGKSCYILEIVDNEFSYKTYLVGEGEDLSMIANKLKVSDYMILEANRKVKFYDDVEAGQQIKVPSSYSKRMLMYVDVNELIPLKIEVYDDKGLFEQFLFKNVKLNVSFKENEFSEDFEEYNF